MMESLNYGQLTEITDASRNAGLMDSSGTPWF